MSLTSSISLFIIVMIFYVLIIDVFTILFRITGLTEEKAKFQVLSLLTNSGYSTKESELIVNVVVRRRIARVIMLFGYVFGVTIVSVFVNLMVSLPNYEKTEMWPLLILTGLVFAASVMIKRTPQLNAWFNHKIEAWGQRWIYGRHANTILVMDTFDNNVIASVVLNDPPEEVEGRSVREIEFKAKYGLQLIFIRRSDGILTEGLADVPIKKGDNLVVFGVLKTIRTLFNSDEDERIWQHKKKDVAHHIAQVGGCEEVEKHAHGHVDDEEKK